MTTCAKISTSALIVLIAVLLSALLIDDSTAAAVGLRPVKTDIVDKNIASSVTIFHPHDKSQPPQMKVSHSESETHSSKGGYAAVTRLPTPPSAPLPVPLAVPEPAIVTVGRTTVSAPRGGYHAAQMDAPPVAVYGAATASALASTKDGGSAAAGTGTDASLDTRQASSDASEDASTLTCAQEIQNSKLNSPDNAELGVIIDKASVAKSVDEVRENISLL
jgi:hypothetical protein